MRVTTSTILNLPSDYIVIGTGGFTKSLLKLLKTSNSVMPRAILDLNDKNRRDLFFGVQVLGYELLENVELKSIVLGTDVFQVEQIKTFCSLKDVNVTFIDVSDDVQAYNNNLNRIDKSICRSEKYILFFSIGYTVPTKLWLRNFFNWLNKKGIEVVFIHPMESISNEKIINATSVIFWNGSTSHFNEIKSRLISLNIKPTYSECGHFPQSKHFYFDKKGVNFSSQLVDDDLKWAEKNNQELIKKTRDFLFGSISIMDSGYVFVPLQIDSDSNIQNHSRFKNGMQEFIEYIESLYPNKRVIFKPHPKDKYKEKYIYSKGEVSLLDTYELISQASIVHGINSSVLFESVLLGKKVIAEGDCLLNHRTADMEAVLAAMLIRQKSVDETEFTAEYLHKFTNFPAF